MRNPTEPGARLLPGTIATNETGAFKPAHIMAAAPYVPSDIFLIMDYDQKAMTRENRVYGLIHFREPDKWDSCIVQYDKSRLNLSDLDFPGGKSFEFIEKKDHWICSIRAQSILASCYVLIKKNEGGKSDAP